MIQPRNGYNQYYFALDSTFFETKLTRPRPICRGQGRVEAKNLASRPVWPPELNITAIDKRKFTGRFSALHENIRARISSVHITITCDTYNGMVW